MTGYTSRILPVDEWPKLAETDLGELWTLLKPADTQVLVVEHEGAIVGMWLGVRIVHAEGVWIAPAHRGGFGVVRRLLAGMRRIARSWGASVVWTGAAEGDTTVMDLITRLGGSRVPMAAYRLPMEGGPCQPS